MSSLLRLDDLATVIRQRAPANGTCFIGVDGPGGAGKSTLARRLATRLDAGVVKVDDFLAWTDFAGWWPRLEDEVLDPLRRGEDARYQVRDWQHDEFGRGLGPWRTTEWHPFVILEGVTSTRRRERDWIDYAIWVDTPRELRLERALARDGESHRELWNRWMVQEDEFFDADGTRDRADLIVDGAPIRPDDPDEELVQVATS